LQPEREPDRAAPDLVALDRITLSAVTSGTAVLPPGDGPVAGAAWLCALRSLIDELTRPVSKVGRWAREEVAAAWLRAGSDLNARQGGFEFRSRNWRLRHNSADAYPTAMEPPMTDLPPLDGNLLPAGVRSRFVRSVNGLRMHVLEAGFERPGRPCVLLLHGFPELAYSWRKVMPALADAGFQVVAPDQRGYGRTTGWSADYDGDLSPFRLLNLAGDALTLVRALGHHTVAAVVGHDFGAPVAAWCALTRPDVFRRVALMSAPFSGPPKLPFGIAGDVEPPPAGEDIHAALASLVPPRKHYQWYFSSRQANAEMHQPPQGLHAFLRAYYHHKSADWPGNQPFRLAAWTAPELAKLPRYYVMDLDRTMPETVATEMLSSEQVAACEWLPDRELAIYTGEYARTGFQGGLNWYRCRTSGLRDADLALFAGRRIDVPSVFIAGAQDWGIYQVPGAIERMQRDACGQMIGCELIAGAGHWVQQERPAEVAECLRRLLESDPASDP
jgi:pimeloyl-ACP methyl ester carboxylesterase